MPAENEPADPNALTQSEQLTCSLTPSSTVPSTRLVIIWLKRWLARSPTELPLESAPVGVGEGGGDGLPDGVGVGHAYSALTLSELVVYAAIAEVGERHSSTLTVKVTVAESIKLNVGMAIVRT